MITVGNYPDLASAQLAKSFLDAEGIPSLIPDEFLAGVDWQMSTAIRGVREAKRPGRYALPIAMVAAAASAVVYLQSGTLEGDVLRAVFWTLGLGVLVFLAVRRLEVVVFGNRGTWRNPDLLICASCKLRVSAGAGSRCDCGGSFEPLNHWAWLPDDHPAPTATKPQ